MNNQSEFLTFAIKIAKEAGKIQMEYFEHISLIEKKSTNIDLVTVADKKSRRLFNKSNNN